MVQLEQQSIKSLHDKDDDTNRSNCNGELKYT